MKNNNYNIGRIIKGVGGQFTVLTEGEQFVCSARGKIKQSERLMIGDFVEFDQSSLNIEQILPRRNQLLRPLVANIDYLLIVIAVTPPPDLVLVDKLIIFAYMNDIEPVLVINKSDMDNSNFFENIQKQYKGSGIILFSSSTKSDNSLSKFPELLKGKLGCFSGQSAVGKSSLINALCGESKMDVGGLSTKLARGKHTTRHAEIILLNDYMLVDTPGFSMLEFKDIPQNELDSYYPEFIDLKNNCKFGGRCSHSVEPNCAVLKAVEAGKISEERHKRYLQLLAELKKNAER